MLGAKKIAVVSVFRLLFSGTLFVSFASLLKFSDLNNSMVSDSITYDVVKNVSTEPEDLLKSLSYYVNGEWVYCGEENGDSLKNITSVFSSLKVVYGQQGRKKKLVHFRADSNTEGCNEHSLRKPLRFVPKSLLPIATSCKDDEDTHCTSKERLSIPVGVELKRFSSQEAAQCLRNQRILMIGDSHMRNFWRAMMDVLVGNNQHDYHRWDGYQNWEDFPTHIRWDEVDQFLPNAMYARMNDHSKIGVQGGCHFIPKGNRDSNITGVGHYWSCLSARDINEARQDFDLRRLKSNVTVAYNITIDASWCASSFRAGLDDRADVRGEECRDARQIYTREKGEEKSYLERLLSQSTYDTVIMGHHVHDIKREYCSSKAEADIRPCREQLGKDIIRNAENFASWAKENKINLLWVTTGPMLLDRIPEQFRNFQLPEDMNYEMKTMAEIMRSKGFPVLDAYHIGSACARKESEIRANGGEWPDCFSDGMHASRFLDREKAQMLLNWKCQH